MKKVTIGFLLVLLSSAFAMASVNVTFNVNSSTVQGFTDSTTVMQIRGGEHNLADDTWHNYILQWSDASAEAMNVGGDYWQATVEFPDSLVGWEINWKVGATLMNIDGTTTDFWEDVPGGGNRNFVLPGTDTTITAYVSHMYDPPYTPSDSIDVYFRVNMSANPDFNPETDMVSIVGDFPSPTGEANMWSPGTYTMTPEAPDSMYYHYHLKLENPSTSYASNGTVDSVYYRFVVGTDWSNTEQIFGHGMFPSNENRGTQVHQDTTLAWKWWNDMPPAGFTASDTVNITFQANLSNAVDNNGFEIGDTLIVHLGYFGSSTEVMTDTLKRQGFTFNYAATVDDVPVSEGAPLYYQYYLYKNGQEQREVYFNFDYTGSNPSEAERRAYMVESAASDLTISDVENSETDARRMPVFRNNELLSQHVTVTLTCDIRPAVFQVLAGSSLMDLQGSNDVTPAMMSADPDTIFKMGVFVNGPMSNDGEGAWQTWGGTLAADTNRTMYDDGTHGDVTAGDSIFTVVYDFDPDSGHTVGQEFKFGIGGGDNESGYGLNHIENIDDSQPTTVMAAQWGSINPNFYSAWDFNNHRPTGISNENPGVVPAFALQQNYPNPFNPTTTFEYSIPQQSPVSITIYNILGQQIYAHTTSQLTPGTYHFTWNGKDNNGYAVSSGVYFYRVQAGSYLATKKMVLMK